MKAFLFSRTLALGLLPALLTLASCGGGDDPAPAPIPDQGRVLFVHAASTVSTVGLKFLVDNTTKTGSLAYGQSSGYQNIAVGTRSVQVSTGTQTAATQAVVVEKNKTYSFFATPGTSASTLNGLLIPDDVTAPATGKARIRIINLTQSVPSTIKLAQVVSTINGPVVTSLVTNVGANTASAFIDAPAGSFELSVLDETDKMLATVGDGSGSGTGTKNYEAGKLYTVLVTGVAGSLTPEQKIRVFVSQNN